MRGDIMVALISRGDDGRDDKQERIGRQSFRPHLNLLFVPYDVRHDE
jgi:hypothetical protein